MKRFKTLLAGVAIVAGAQFAAGAANAATVVCYGKDTCNFSTVTSTGGAQVNPLTGTSNKLKPTTATSMFEILLPSAGTFEISFSPTGSGKKGTNTGLTFTSLVFNGTPISNPKSGDLYDFDVTKAGWYKFSISSSNNASNPIGYTASYSFAAVPEPAAWGLMIGGFGMAGASIRRRRNVRVAVA